MHDTDCWLTCSLCDGPPTPPAAAAAPSPLPAIYLPACVTSVSKGLPREITPFAGEHAITVL